MTVGPGKDAITTFIVFSADDSIIPPMIKFSYFRPPKDIINIITEHWFLDRKQWLDRAKNIRSHLTKVLSIFYNSKGIEHIYISVFKLMKYEKS